MKAVFTELVTFIKNPILQEDLNKNFSYRLHKFKYVLFISMITGLLLMPFFGLIEVLDLIDMENHAMEKLMKEQSKLVIAFLAIIIAPLFEELIFRGPLTLFKNSTAFKIAYYVFALLFGLVHITNFELTTAVVLLTPILVAPQVILGLYLGFIRVRFGLAWSVCLHGLYNAFFIGFSLLESNF